MDFLLCCPRGPDHQGRHAVPEAESAADGPPWAAGAEKDRKRKKIGHAASLAARLNSQRIERRDLRRKVREEMGRSASRFRHGCKACGVNLVICSVREVRGGSVKDAAGRDGASQSAKKHTRVFMRIDRAMPASNAVSHHSCSYVLFNT